MSIIGSWFPTGKPSAQDALWNIALSDNSGQTNFKYVFDVYDYNNDQVIRTKVFPHPSNGRGYFDAGSVVRNMMKYDWFIPYSIICYYPNVSGEIAAKYAVQIGEDYNVGASGITTLNMASGEITAYNFVPDVFNRGQEDYSNYEGKYLTTRKNRKYTIRKDQRFMIGYYASTSPITIKVNKTTASTTTLNTYDVNVEQPRILQLDIGTKGINESLSNFLSDAISYTFQIGNGEIWYFTINDCVTDHDPKYIHFLNRFGMYETCEFDCVSKLTSDTERKAFAKSGYEFLDNQVRVKDADNIYMETKINYATETSWIYKLMKNFPTDDDWIWMEQLVYSPIMYLQENGYYYPVTLKNSNYERFKQIYAKLKTFEIDIEVNQKRYGFLR